MNCYIIEQNQQKCVECYAAEPLIKTEQDAIDLVAACGENDTNLLLLHAEALSEDFFKLKTKAAGRVLQKFINYRVKTAILIREDLQFSDRFKEFLSEANKGNEYRTFVSKDKALNWLFG